MIDLGSGGGVPGLVIAHDRPDLHVTLLDRRTKRTDFLERSVRRLGWTERVSVVAPMSHRSTPTPSFDAAVARGFGPPAETLTVAARLRDEPVAHVVISEPPTGDRWAGDAARRGRGSNVSPVRSIASQSSRVSATRSTTLPVRNDVGRTMFHVEHSSDPTSAPTSDCFT